MSLLRMIKLSSFLVLIAFFWTGCNGQTRQDLEREKQEISEKLSEYKKKLDTQIINLELLLRESVNEGKTELEKQIRDLKQTRIEVQNEIDSVQEITWENLEKFKENANALMEEWDKKIKDVAEDLFQE